MAAPFLRFQNVSFGYDGASESLFKGVDFQIGPGWTGLVGPNGVGKTTLLRLAQGELVPQSGAVVGSELRTYCPQRTDYPPVDGGGALFGPGRTAALLRADFGLEESWLDRWPDLSHGERKRIQVASALVQRPDLLALDEPTNHLDRAAREMLLSGLIRFKGVGLLVSHDRDLLDRLCAAVIFIDSSGVIIRPGAYTQAAAQADRDRAALNRSWDLAAEEAARLEKTWSDRRRRAARSSARRSKAGLAKKDSDGRARIDLARVTGQDAARSRLQRQVKGRLDQARRNLAEHGFTKEHPAGIEVLGEAYRGDRLVLLPSGSIDLGPGRRLTHPDLIVRPGNRIRLTGPNGAGKSSLLRALVAGFGLALERLVYLPQEISADRSRAVLEEARSLDGPDLGWVMNMVSRLGSRPRRLLDSDLPSPGEVRKLWLALGLRRRPWLIVLDEPTNHLDLPSIEALETALAETVAALVLVSHDRRFGDALTGTEWRIGTDRVDSLLETD